MSDLTKKLTFDQARELTGRIKEAVEGVWNLIKQAHDGRAWAVLSYGTWEDYVKQEFQMSRRQSYQLLDYAKIRENLCTPVHTAAEPTPSEFQARPLAKLDTPEQQREAWQAAVETSGGKPTAKHVEAAVDEILSKEEPEEEPVDYTPANGMQYARMAITQLEKIHAKDTQRALALKKVANWISSHK